MKFFIVAALCLLGLASASMLGTQMYPESYYGPYRHMDELVHTPWLSQYSIPSMNYPYGYAKGFQTPKYYSYGQTYPTQKLMEHPISTHHQVAPVSGLPKPVLGQKEFYLQKYVSTPVTKDTKLEGKESYGYPYAYYPYGQYPYGSEKMFRDFPYGSMQTYGQFPYGSMKNYGQFPYGSERTYGHFPYGSIKFQHMPLEKNLIKEAELEGKMTELPKTGRFMPEEKFMHTFTDEKLPKFTYPKTEKYVPYWYNIGHQQLPYRYETSEYFPKSFEYLPIQYGTYY